MSSLSSVPLKQLIEKFGITTLVETGCHTGDGIVAALAAGCKVCYSCDIDPEKVDRCKELFRGQDVHLFNESSIKFIARIVSEVKEPVIFWLDAHFPAVFTEKKFEVDKWDWPLMEELRQIALRPPCDIILADDTRIICDPLNPTYEFVTAELTQHISWKSVVEALPQHGHELIRKEQGILLWTPKLSG